MTFREVVTAVLRRWYAPLVVLLAAAAFTTQLVTSGGLYSTRTAVFFINQPQQVVFAPNNGSADSDIIAFAGAVANDVNNGRPAATYARADARLYGAGIVDGVSVALQQSDDGGQWRASFNRADIEIEIVGPTHEYVESLQRELLLKVFDRSRELQGPAYNDPDARIRTQVLPLTMTIDHIYASRREQVIAFASMLAAAMIVGSWVAVRLDELIRGRSARRERQMEATDPMLEKAS